MSRPIQATAAEPLAVRHVNLGRLCNGVSSRNEAPSAADDNVVALPSRPVSPGADTRNGSLPYHVAEYASEIIAYLKEREVSTPRDPNYLANQPDVTERMRLILVDWLVDVHLKFKLHPETFYLAVDYVDRFLMKSRGARATLQLVGVSAMLLAAKHEEIWPPEVRECIYISANTYTRDEILQMERDIAEALHFRFCVPTPYPFMARLLDVTDAVSDCCSIANMCLDISALEYGCLKFLPSQIGYAAFLIAQVTMENSYRSANGAPAVATGMTTQSPDLLALWTPEVAFYAKTTAVDLSAILECANAILAAAVAVNSPNSRYHAVKRKFSAERYSDVASRYTLPTSL